MSKPQKKIGQDFPCSINYLNPLPPLPFEPKLLKLPKTLSRHYEEVYGSLHTTTPIDIPPLNASLGMQASPLALEPFTDKSKFLDEKDRELLAPYREVVPGTNGIENGSAGPARPLASWLRRSEVMSIADIKQQTKTKPDPAAAMHKQHLSPPRKYAHLSVKDRFLKTVEHTFDVAAKANVSTLKHPTNPNLTVKEILPVFPDFENWANRYRLVMYDGDPIHVEKAKEEGDSFNIPLEEAILKPLKHPTNPRENFIAYYAPNAQSIAKISTKRLLADDDEEDEGEYDYEYVRDFTFKQKPADSEQMIFVEIREEEGAAFYMELGDRMVLTKKRAASRMERRHRDEEEIQKATHYTVSYRPQTKGERRRKKAKLEEVLLRGEAGGDEEEEGLESSPEPEPEPVFERRTKRAERSGDEREKSGDERDKSGDERSDREERGRVVDDDDDFDMDKELDDALAGTGNGDRGRSRDRDESEEVQAEEREDRGKKRRIVDSDDDNDRISD
ncbi:RNA polymerase-associated factor [Phlyctochytrium planicorne]|nr:RNA polymerase-associated factor [Phlyctochytrium planicorne]